MNADQAPVYALLQGLAGRPPIETHISAVFVGANTVWKLRRAVVRPFLDFSVLAERKRTARREFELNAPHAPGLYRDVVPVTKTEYGLELNGPGTPVDWVVRMARVPAHDFLDQMAQRGAITAVLLDQIADAVAALHGTLAPVTIDHAAALRRVAQGNLDSAHAAGLSSDALATWWTGITAALDGLAPWLETRARQGFVRRAHGDLHLGNLCLWQGHPVAFDALEFDEALATIDVGYDLAFLLMDLDRRCGRAAANRVLNRYVARTGDAALVAGLRLFLSLRAMVRAHVSASSGQDASAYLATALNALHPPPGRTLAIGALAIGGLQGTGKTTLARRIAPHFGPAPGALIVRSDEIRKRLNRVAPEEHLPPSAYAEPVSRAVLAELLAEFAAAVACGHGVIADATFIDPIDRSAVAACAGATPFEGVWLEAPMEVLEARLAARTGDASDANATVLHQSAQADPGEITWTLLNSADADELTHFVARVTKPTQLC